MGGRVRGRIGIASLRNAEDPMAFALRLLARRDRSEAEIRRALERRKIAEGDVRRVLGRLGELRYIDDPRLAADVAERFRRRGFGSLRIRAELRKIGIEEKLAGAVETAPAEERTIARQALEARFGEEPPGDPPARARAARFLASRGFPEDVVASLIPFEE